MIVFLQYITLLCSVGLYFPLTVIFLILSHRDSRKNMKWQEEIGLELEMSARAPKHNMMEHVSQPLGHSSGVRK